MEMLWFCAISLMLTLYIVLDGFDLGTGVVYLFAARSTRERRSALTAIAPFWDGNEMWLLIAALVLYCAFPVAYAVAFSDYYFTLLIALSVLLLRGFGGDALNRMPNDGSRAALCRLLEVLFSAASLAVSVLFGVMLGNLARGVPLSQAPRFLDWFTLLWGFAALSVTALTGALWLAFKTEGEFQSRCRGLASRLWWAVLVSGGCAAAATLSMQPRFLDSLRENALRDNSWLAFFAVAALAGLLGTRLCLSVGFDLGAVGSTLALTAGLFGAVAAGHFPDLLGSGAPGSTSLTLYNASAGSYHLGVGMLWWIPAFALTFSYKVLARRRFPKAKEAFLAAPRPEVLMPAGK